MTLERNGIRLNNPLHYRLLIFFVLSALYFLACLHRISPTVIARDLMSAFGADATALGVMSSAYFYLYAAVQPPVGVLSDTWGPRAVVTLFAAIACCGVLLFGLAPGMTVATIGRALIGIGVGGVFVPALKLFSNWYRSQEFAGMTGLFLAVGNAGNLAASLPLTYLVLWLGWRMSHVAISVATLVLIAVSWLVLRDRPEDKGWPPLVQSDGTDASAAAQVPAGMSAGKRLGIVFSQPNFWMVSLSTFFFGGPTLTFQGLWAVPYLMDVHAFSRVQAGGMLMLLPLGFVIGAPTFGLLADRLPVGRKSVLLAALSLSLVCWGVFLFSGGRPHPYFIGPCFLIIGACGGGSLSLYMTITKELFPPWLTGTAIGLMNPAAFFSTALFQPFSGYLMDIVGAVGDAYPLAAYQNVFIAIFVFMVLGLMTVIPLRLPHVR